MKTSMYDFFLSRADGAHIAAWQIGDRTVSEDEARRRLSIIELSSEDWVNPEGASRGTVTTSTWRHSARRLGPPSGCSSPSAHTRAACGSTALRAIPGHGDLTGPSGYESLGLRDPGRAVPVHGGRAPAGGLAAA